MKENDTLIPLKTPVVIVPHNWIYLIERRAVFFFIYGTVAGYGQKQIVKPKENIEYSTQATVVVSIKGKTHSIAGFEHDETAVFDKNGFKEYAMGEIEKIGEEILELRAKTHEYELFANKIPDTAIFLKEFWKAHLASMKENVRYLSEKKRELEEWVRKAERKLSRMEEIYDNFL